MGIKDRINDEMVVDTESVLEEYFEEAKQLFEIFQDGTVNVRGDFEEAPWRERIIIHLIGRRYAYEGGNAETPTLPYTYLYARIDKDDSTIRGFVNDLKNENLVFKNEEEGEWQLHVERLPEALSRIEGFNQ